MEKNKKTAKLPALIYRNEKAIESEIFNIRNEREGVGADIETLVKSLSNWMEKPIPLEWLLGFVEAEEYELDLLQHFQSKNKVPDTVRFEKIKEVYNVPDFSHILEQATSLRGHEKEYLLRFIKGETVVIPEVTKGEKEAIIEKYSTYILTENTWIVFCAIKHLCDYANTINFEVFANSPGRNKILKSDLFPAIPNEYRKLIDWNMPEAGTERRVIVPNYENFKNR